MEAEVTELRGQSGQESIFHGAIVIGGGAAGLAAAHALKKAGVPTLVLEKESRLAELWYRRHQRLHLNSHRDLRHCLASTIPQALPRPTQNCAQAFAVASPMPASRPTQSRSRSPGRGDD
jgi:cation diffusion facilitator CzcD-associated flavoprotein CzcO